MALAEGQVQIRDLVMGPGTPYTLRQFNPFVRNTRADQGGPRAWNHGTWSGAEFLEETTVPMRIFIRGGERTSESWLDAYFPLMAAFEPVGDSVEDAEMRFVVGGTEYLMFGRPRMVEPDVEVIGIGKSMVEAAFVANNPRIFSSEEHTVTFNLPRFTSGVVAPLYSPIYVTGAKVGGEGIVINGGSAETGIKLRIDGPVDEPLIMLRDPDGDVHRLKVGFNLTNDQWLDIDTANRSVLLSSTANRRGQVSGDFFKVMSGTSTLYFTSNTINDEALLTARWRYAW